MKTRRHFLIAACSALLAAMCAHNPPPPPPTPPPSVPAAAVQAICDRVHSEGISTRLHVVKRSQPLITPATLSALGSAMFYTGHAHAEVTPGTSVPVEAQATCVSGVIDKITDRESDTIVVEFSAPALNPFAHNQLGVFARASLGDEAATWYWVPIGESGGVWGAASPLMLSFRE